MVAVVAAAHVVVAAVVLEWLQVPHVSGHATSTNCGLAPGCVVTLLPSVPPHSSASAPHVAGSTAPLHVALRPPLFVPAAVAGPALTLDVRAPGVAVVAVVAAAAVVATGRVVAAAVAGCGDTRAHATAVASAMAKRRWRVMAATASTLAWNRTDRAGAPNPCLASAAGKASASRCHAAGRAGL